MVFHQPSLRRLADDRAVQLDVHDVWVHLIAVLREETGGRGEFAAVRPVPASSGEVPDEPEARLVIIGPEHPHINKDEHSPALVFAQDVLSTRGNSPRLYQNMVVFLAPDKQRLQELEEATRFHMAWISIVNDGSLDFLTPSASQPGQGSSKGNAGYGQCSYPGNLGLATRSQPTRSTR